jgi:hypothetical protein
MPNAELRYNVDEARYDKRSGAAKTDREGGPQMQERHTTPLKIDEKMLADYPELAVLTLDLPESDGEPLETERERMQINLLLDVLDQHWQDRQDFYAAGNMFLYYFWFYCGVFHGLAVRVDLGQLRDARLIDGEAPDALLVGAAGVSVVEGGELLPDRAPDLLPLQRARDHERPQSRAGVDPARRCDGRRRDRKRAAGRGPP